MSEVRQRHAFLAFGLTTLALVVLIAVLFTVTTPDLDNLPAYDCVPGHHHTTKECAQ